MIELSAVPPATGSKPPAILSLIGDTPLLEITRMDTGPCQLFLKLENQNPTGSIKDRIALSMIEAAERDGSLAPGGTIIEATAGNTGLGLALIASAKGYRCLLVIPDKMSQEKIAHVRALGAEVRMTRSDVTRGHPEYYQDMAARLAKDRLGAYLVGGIISGFAFQVIYNVTMSAGLAPVKGITLPLMSYGGSSLIASLAGFGLILNVRMRRFTN